MINDERLFDDGGGLVWYVWFGLVWFVLFPESVAKGSRL